MRMHILSDFHYLVFNDLFIPKKCPFMYAQVAIRFAYILFIFNRKRKELPLKSGAMIIPIGLLNTFSLIQSSRNHLSFIN